MDVLVVDERLGLVSNRYFSYSSSLSPSINESANFRFVGFDGIELCVEAGFVDKTDGFVNMDRNGLFFGRNDDNAVVDSDSVRRRRARSR